MSDEDKPLSRGERIAVALLQTGLGCGLFGGWIYATETKRVSPLMLPPLESIIVRFGEIMRAGQFWGDLGVTSYEMMWAFLISSIGGLTIGFLASRRNRDKEVFEPLLAGLYSIPVIIIYPLYVLFFGLGVGSKIALGATVAVFPIALGAIAGFSSAPQPLLRASRAMGASNWKTLTHVLIPAAAPVVFAGLRVGFILAFLSIIGGEMLASYRGVGRLIINEAEAMNTARMYAYVIFLVLLSLGLNASVFVLEARLARRWRPG